MGSLQLGIATQVSVIKVKVTVTKNRNLVSLNNFSLLWTIDTKLAAWNQCNQTNGIIFFFTAMFHFLFLSYQHLVESLKTWFRRIAAFLVDCNIKAKEKKHMAYLVNIFVLNLVKLNLTRYLDFCVFNNCHENKLHSYLFKN